MNDHKVIDTNELKSKRFTFSTLSEKTKNILIAGGLSFAGIATAIGLSKLFISEDTFEDQPAPNSSQSFIDENTVVNEQDEIHETEEVLVDNIEEVEVETLEEYEIEAEFEESTYTITFDTEAQFAQSVDNGMTFPAAFAQAREEVGHGGFFNWNDNTYSTYTEEEWNAMSYEDQQSFFSDVSSKSELNVDSWTVESNEPSIAVEMVEEENLEVIEPIELEVQDIESEEEVVEASSSFDTNVVEEGDVATITIVPPATYGTADINADNIVDAIAVDNNNDGHADLLALDEDFDGIYETFLINEDGDEDLDVFIIDQGADGIDDTDEIVEIADVVDMEDFIIIDEDDEALEGLDFIDDLIDINGDDEMTEEEDINSDDLSFDDPGL